MGPHAAAGARAGEECRLFSSPVHPAMLILKDSRAPPTSQPGVGFGFGAIHPHQGASAGSVCEQEEINPLRLERGVDFL